MEAEEKKYRHAKRMGKSDEGNALESQLQQGKKRWNGRQKRRKESKSVRVPPPREPPRTGSGTGFQKKEKKTLSHDSRAWKGTKHVAHGPRARA